MTEATTGQSALEYRCRCGSVFVRTDKAGRGHYCVDCARVAMRTGRRVVLEVVGWRVTP